MTKLRSVFKVFSVLIIICFFVPICTVSCGGYTIDISGFKLVTGFTVAGEKMPNYWPAISLLIIPTVMLILTFKKTMNNRSLSIAHLIGSGLEQLLIIVLTALIRSSAEKNLIQYKNAGGFWFYTLIVFCQAAVAILVLTNVLREESTGIKILSDNDRMEAVNGWTCSACGNKALFSQKYCAKCGAPKPDGNENPELRDSDQMYCSNCGATVNISSKFCRKCGSRLDNEKESEFDQ